MPDICFQTHAFPTAPEGDLDLCNGMPGSALAQWVRAALLEEGFSCREPIQEDYGWGFWIDRDGCSVWVGVSYSGGTQDDQAAVPEWWIGVAHEFLFFPSQWFKSRWAKAVVHEAFAVIEAAVGNHPAINVLKVVPGSTPPPTP